MRFYVMVFVCLLFVTAQADAHKVTGALWTDGAYIEGEVGFSNGSYAPEGSIVRVLDRNERILGEVRIDAEGLFRFQPREKITHHFRVDLGAGHIADLVMQADEIPLDGVVAEQDITALPSALEGSGDLQDIVRQAVRKEVQPLRRELAQYKEKNDLQTILGGLGYILGLCGLGFYLMARKKQAQNGP